MMMNFLLYSWKEKEKVYEFFNVCNDDKTGEAKPSNNISEKLTGRKPVSEHSERASGYIVE